MEFKVYLAILLRRKFIFLSVVGAIVVLPLLQSLVAGDIYQATASVMINKKDQQAEFLKSIPGSIGELTFVDSANVSETILQQFKNSLTISKLIDKLGIDEKVSGFCTSYPYLKFLFNLQDNAVKIKQVEESEVFEIRGYSTSQSVAVEISNTLLNLNIDRWRSEKKNIAIKVQKAIAHYLEQIESQIAEYEQQQKNFFAKEKIGNIDVAQSTLYGALVTYEYDLHKLQLTMKAVEQEQRAVKKAMSEHPEFTKSTVMSRVNPVVDKARTALADLVWQLASKRPEFAENHPDIVALNSQIASIKETIKESNLKYFYGEDMTRDEYFTSLVKRYSDSQIDKVINEIKYDAIRKHLESITQKIIDLSVKSVDLGHITAEITRLKTVKSEALNAIDAARTAELMDMDNITIIHYADPSLVDAYFPSSKSSLLIFCTLLGSALGFFAVLLVDYIDPAYSSVRDLQSLTKIPVTACVRKFPAKSSLQASSVVVSEAWADEGWGVMNALLAREGDGVRRRVIALTSAMRGEGKTLTSLAMANAFARMGEKVLLMDLNLRRPATSRVLGSNSEKGLTEVLTQKISLAAAVSKIGEQIDFLPASVEVPQEVRCSASLKDLIARAKAEASYSRIILDFPSLADDSTAMALASAADIVFLVAAVGMARCENVVRDYAALQQVAGRDSVLLVATKTDQV